MKGAQSVFQWTFIMTSSEYSKQILVDVHSAFKRVFIGYFVGMFRARSAVCSEAFWMVFRDDN
jgi:hypothetical protein